MVFKIVLVWLTGLVLNFVFFQYSTSGGDRAEPAGGKK